MATQSVIPTIKGYPTHCDRCNCAVSYSTGYVSREAETEIGSFKYTYCPACESVVARKRKASRHSESRRAMVRRAARVSPTLAQVVASWFGIPKPRKFERCGVQA